MLENLLSGNISFPHRRKQAAGILNDILLIGL